MKYQDVIYYEDELNDDFGTTVSKIHPLPKKYKYIIKNPIQLFLDFILYRIIVRPLALVYMKIKFHQKIINKKILKKVKTGYFLYGNHATIIGDAFTPNLLSLKTKNYILTGEQANSLRWILPILRGIGALPITNNLSENKKLVKAMKKRIDQKSSIAIYPEAHVWPYYTKIRPYSFESFKYPARFKVPVFSLTTCFQKRKFRKRPKLITYVDGPFYPNENLSMTENATHLRNMVYEAMVKRSTEASTYSYFIYKKKED